MGNSDLSPTAPWSDDSRRGVFDLRDQRISRGPGSRNAYKLTCSRGRNYIVYASNGQRD